MKRFGWSYIISVALWGLLTTNIAAQKPSISINSPDGKIEVQAGIDAQQQAYYKVYFNRQLILQPSRLGVVRADADFSKNIKLLSSSPIEKITNSYRMIYGKRSHCVYEANKKVLHLHNAANDHMDIIFQVSNDGIAFRYYFPDSSRDQKQITEEVTTYHFPPSAKAWLQPMDVAKSGWEHTNPSYEEHYQQSIAVGTPSPTKAGWVYPALFQSNNAWVLITEADMDGTYCATRLQTASPSGEYQIGSPDPREVFTGGGYLPQAPLPFYSPWRIITIGSLKTIIESTLGTDVAKPSKITDTGFIKPGKASWSWIMSKDDSIVYSEQKRYIDFAADMHWQYCLIDVNWDTKIGFDKTKELADYAAAKNVGLLLWYNSSGDWNTTKYTPKSKLLTHEDRVSVFSRLKAMGIKGVKIDFFGGDGQSVIQYYLDILKDAADYQLLVNFHGATLPRGWSRTYPHLLTTEAVRGFEMVTFGQQDADAEANHCAMLPFTRNAFDPMDFTPMNLYKIPTNVVRKTTSAFELALSVLFLSGIQHYAESPQGMSHVPAYVKQFLRTLPNSWEEVQFIDGYPGKYVVLARKAGSKWYITGINATDSTKTISLNLSIFHKAKATLVTDGAAPLSFKEEVWKGNSSKQIAMQPQGGFVIVLE